MRIVKCEVKKKHELLVHFDWWFGLVNIVLNSSTSLWPDCEFVGVLSGVGIAMLIWYIFGHMSEILEFFWSLLTIPDELVTR